MEDGMSNKRGNPVFVWAHILTAATAVLSVAALRAQEASPPRQVKVKVAVVAADLSVKPVPKYSLSVCRQPGCQPQYPCSSDLEGTLTVTLPPGDYTIASKAPLDFEGKRYSWSLNFTLPPDKDVSLELSNDNASIEALPQAANTGESDEGRIFEKVKNSVFKIFSDDASGSGFLVDASGLVLTNYHVVRGSDYLAVKVSESEKYPAVLVATDAVSDLAVLRVNPEAVKNLFVLSFAQDSKEHPAVRTGQRVMAIGSPLSTETILSAGLVSKVEADAILSDVNINEGNSGGPLLDLQGNVVGICTFKLAGSGAGVSGILRPVKAISLLDSARQKLSVTACPLATKLPVESSIQYPPELLRQACATQTRREEQYQDSMGPFAISYWTPVLASCLKQQQEAERAKRLAKHRNGKDTQEASSTELYGWQKYAGEYSPVVMIVAMPEIGSTGGSIFLKILTEGTSRSHLKYKTSFRKMELIRDGKTVEPIKPGRSSTEIDMNDAYAKASDAAYFGVYEYPPEAFRPGAKLVLRIWDEKRESPKEESTIPEKIRAQIWRDYEPYFKATEAGG
jgi:hypothetical protein